MAVPPCTLLTVYRYGPRASWYSFLYQRNDESLCMSYKIRDIIMLINKMYLLFIIWRPELCHKIPVRAASLYHILLILISGENGILERIAPQYAVKYPVTYHIDTVSALYSNLKQSCRSQCFLYRAEMGVTTKYGKNALNSNRQRRAWDTIGKSSLKI